MLRNFVEAFSSSPRSQSPIGKSESRRGDFPETPFTKFVLSRLDEDSAKIFAISFAEHVRNDPDDRVIEFDSVYLWLGFTRIDNGIRLLKKEFENSEIVFLTKEGASGGRPKDSYLISINQFEHLLMMAKTEEGKAARKMLLIIKRAAFDWMKIELEEKDIRIQAATAAQVALQRQLENIRTSKYMIYAFWMHANHFKCGFTTDVTQREKAFKTGNPSGKMVHVIRVNSNFIEKVFESSMKRSGNHVAGEEYIFPGGESQVALVLNTFARCDEALHVIPISNYQNLLAHIDAALAQVQIDPTDDISSTQGASAALGIPVTSQQPSFLTRDDSAIGTTDGMPGGDDTEEIVGDEGHDDSNDNICESHYNASRTEDRFFDMSTYRRFNREMCEAVRGKSELTCDLMVAFEEFYKERNIVSHKPMQAGSNLSYGFDINFKKEFVETMEEILGTKQTRPDKRSSTSSKRGFWGILLKSH